MNITYFKSEAGSLANVLIRFVLALVLWPHGAQKLLGWFGGYGFEGTMNYFTGAMGLPWILGFLVIIIEFFAPALLLLGVWSRVAALGIFVVMVGAMVTSHLDNGFFMNWFGTQQGEGIEYFILMLGLSAAVIIQGEGRISLTGLRLTHKTEVAGKGTGIY